MVAPGPRQWQVRQSAGSLRQSAIGGERPRRAPLRYLAPPYLCTRARPNSATRRNRGRLLDPPYFIDIRLG